MGNQLTNVAYPAIGGHGLIGDRRTAGLVAADGTLDWLCLPNYDGVPIFGALLDVNRGGFWRLGPRRVALGEQDYLEDTGLLATRWELAEGELELTDLMAWPEKGGDHRANESERVVVRRLRCTRGQVEAVMDIRPRYDFTESVRVRQDEGGLVLEVGEFNMGLWTSIPVEVVNNGATVRFQLAEGDEVWAVLDLEELPGRWSLQRARDVLEETRAYWSAWLGGLVYDGPQRRQVRRSTLAIQMLTYIPAGSLVAAPTTSLPERIGGPRNWDYRYAWVRDASLSLAILSMVGDTTSARHYMAWLTGLGSSTDAPLQVVYGVDGEVVLPERERSDIAGYRQSLPVRYGNRAYDQRQLGSLGWFTDCALVYLQEGGEWDPSYWELVRRAAEYTTQNWRKPDHGIWELGIKGDFVSSKVMCWVALDRAAQIAEQLGHDEPVDRWRAEMERIHGDVMEQGWSDKRQAFVQRYGAEVLDSAVLLIPIMGFLPPDHPRVLATIERIEETLTIDGFVYRYGPLEEEGHPDLPLSEFEGAFLPCTFWLATVYAKLGRVDEAEAILAKADTIAGPLGLFAEEVDPRDKTFLGNFPLLFSQFEYVRAVLALSKTRPIDRARLLAGKLTRRVDQMLGGN